jgi:hypothetical protein
MTEPISHTAYDDAPLSSAKQPKAIVPGTAEGNGADIVGRSVTINRPRHELYQLTRH